MKRLVLVGNGFDLSHNLKTSYSDFIFDYLYKVFSEFVTNGHVINPLIEIRPKMRGVRIKLDIPENLTGIIELIKSFKNNDHIECTIKSKILHKSIYTLISLNWVDLENIYFESLIELRVNNRFNKEKIDELNSQFALIKNELEIYLTRVENEFSHELIPAYFELFTEYIYGNEIITKKIDNKLPDSILLLNFNYTNTLERYVESSGTVIRTEINYIHGQLNSSINPIIFGFGDEFNKNYLEFESLNEKSLFQHIKSFWYFKTSNYHNLIRFIDSGDYQVYIIGHSLGLSDRTMLKTIFEHDNCKSIKVFYHQISATKNDYTEKTFDISNHISDKSLLRKKVISFNFSKPMPSKIEGKSS